MNLLQKLGLLAFVCLFAFFVWPHQNFFIYLGGIFALLGFIGSTSYVLRGNRDALRRWRKTGRIDSAFIQDPPKQKE